MILSHNGDSMRLTKRLLHLFLAVCLAVFSACKPPPSNYPYKKEPDPRKAEYVIGVSDQLRITIWGHSDISSTVNVRPDGTVTLPLLGDLRAAGRTPGSLRQAVQTRLVNYVKNPSATVTVSVIQVNSYRFTVAGNAARPGTFSPRRYVTVAEGIAMAGGANRFASAEKTVLIRRGAKGEIRRIPINYPELEKGQNLEQNIVLLRDDTIYIP
jgi:polysaccharide export outer membrane protein